MKIVALSGSLRQASSNTALLRAAAQLLPAPHSLDILAIGELPLFNEDLSSEEQLAGVRAFREQIEQAQALLIATPEYNYGIPGPLKNALDWASRPSYRSPLAQKPVGILGASAGVVGTARAQGQLKQVLLGVIAQVFPYPEFLVSSSSSKFNEQGELSDETTQKYLERFLVQFVEWVEKVNPSST